MTSIPWRTVALCALAALSVVLVVSVTTRHRAEADAALAHAQLDSVRVSLKHAQTLARAGMSETAAKRATIDSLWREIMRLKAADRIARQRTTRRIDVTDTLETVTMIATLTAERDTALGDLELVRQQNAQLIVQADALRLAALEHARADSVRLAAIDSTTGVASQVVTRARDTIRPRWWTRLGRGLATGMRGAVLVGAGVLAGRHL